jgi:hypothetical protein
VGRWEGMGCTFTEKLIPKVRRYSNQTAHKNLHICDICNASAIDIRLYALRFLTALRKPIGMHLFY